MGRHRKPSDNTQRIQDFLLALPDALFERSRQEYYADPENARVQGRSKGEQRAAIIKQTRLRKERKAS